MKVIHRAQELTPEDQGACVAIGMFDGVHLGHQRILQETIKTAGPDVLPAVVTFDQHPNAIVAPERTPPLIYSAPQRLRAIEAAGIRLTWLIHFDRAFSQQSADGFVRTLVRDFGRLEGICVGRDFTFGHKRKGNVTLLEELGGELGFVVVAVPPVRQGNEIVSSTRIRAAIRAGQIGKASELLGRPYAVAGTILEGQKLGTKLGYPTANLDVRGLGLPPTGVYAGFGQIGEKRLKAVANIGWRPTLNLPKPELRFEVHLLDFSEGLYGQELEFEFGRKLRGEEKFGSLSALREQIGKDVAQTRALLS